ncbi:MAG: hypothetical protein PVG65_00090 [Candidatus Thorarchaeota archaeon]|jgi:hypothetical protein
MIGIMLIILSLLLMMVWLLVAKVDTIWYFLKHHPELGKKFRAYTGE